MINIAVVLPVAFIIGYIYSSHLLHSIMKNRLENKFKKSFVTRKDTTTNAIKTSHIYILIASSFLAVASCGPIFLNGNPETFPTLLLIACLFLCGLLFIFHIPDSLLCLALWRRSAQKILDKRTNAAGKVKLYETSVLFKHERLLFPMPHLEKIIVSFFNNPQLGPQEAIKRLTHLYLFTFQQKQALAALFELWREKENGHLLAHYLLEAKNMAMLEELDNKSPLPSLYFDLAEAEGEARQLIKVSSRMAALNNYHLNTPMVQTLETANSLLAANNLTRFFEAFADIEIQPPLPDCLDYFKIIQAITAQLITIKKNLSKTVTIERFETKRSILEEQIKQLDKLIQTTVGDLYEPFKSIWQKALMNLSALVEKEIDLLHGSAHFDIQLINYELLSGAGEQHLHFTVANNGQELGRNVTFTLKIEGDSIDFKNHSPHTFDFFETGHNQKITFPITAHSPGKCTAKLSLTYSDRTRQDKHEIFSFPITITEKESSLKKSPIPISPVPH